MKRLLSELGLWLFAAALGVMLLFCLVILFGSCFTLIAVLALPAPVGVWYKVFPQPEGNKWVAFFGRVVFSFIMLVGALCPFRALAQPLFAVMGGTPSDEFFARLLFPGRWFEIFVGCCGGLMGAGYLSEAAWRARSARQVINLATSKARSAHVGLSEFRGTVRQAAPLDDRVDSLPEGAVFYFVTDCPDGVDGNVMWEWLQAPVTRPFYLEDETGRILVDASRAKKGGSLVQFFLGHRICEVILTRHGRSETGEASGVPWLEDGDPIYLVGYVEENPDAPAGAMGSDRLIVRMAPQATVLDSLAKKLGINLKGRGRRDVHDVFIMSDTTETDTRKIILKGFHVRLVTALVWLALSVFNVWWVVR